MHSKLIHQSPDGQRTFVVVLETGDEVASQIKAFADREKLKAAQLTAIGAFSDAVLGYFDWGRKDYDRIEVREQVEVLSLLGDFAFDGEHVKLHAHAVLGRRDGSACGGHLLAAKVRPTLEVIVTQSPGYLARAHDPVSRLALIRLDR